MNDDLAGRDGGCLCGAVRFHAAGAPKWVGHCHCNDCRKATGSPFTTFTGYATDTVSWTGEPAVYSSSAGVYRRFCSACGSPLSYASDRWEGEVHLYVCTFDKPEDFDPEGHVYTKFQLPWIHLNDGLPRRDVP